MNSLIRNTFRPSITTCGRFTPRAPYSTAIDVAESPVHEEPDKLYKSIEIEMRAGEPATMKSYSQFAKMAADHLGITVGKCWIPFKPIHDRDNLTLLRSCFVKKDHRVQYEIRTYFRYMTFHHMTGSTADTFLEYIERNLPEGIALKVTKVTCEKLPEEVITPLPEQNVSDDGQGKCE